MTGDPFMFRCRGCGTPLDLPADAGPDTEWCAGTHCAYPRRSRLATLASRFRPRPRRDDVPDDGLAVLGDRIAWHVDLRYVTVRETRIVADWLALHGIALRRVADHPGVLEICLGPTGAYLAVTCDDGPHRTELVMAPPELGDAVSHQPIRRRDIAEGTPATS